METHQNNTPDPFAIRNILTLRYDPSQKPLLPKISPTDFKNSQPSIEHIELLIEKSLKKTQDKSPEKIAVALSGGIDSTLALFFLRKIFPESVIEAISVKFADSTDESVAGAKIAEHFDAKHHIVTIDNYLEELPKAISIVGLPFWDLHWYYVAKKAQTLAKYLASGDGGDEIFGGYTFRYKKFLSLVDVNSTPLQKVKAYLECHERDSVPNQGSLFGKKSQFSWEEIYKILVPYFDNSLSLLDQVFLADYNGKLLYNFSIVNNKINNHHGLETITPLISNEIISYMMAASNIYKYDPQNNLGKLLLRKILSKYDIESLVSNEKLGFSVNTISLWESRGQALCAKYLEDARLVKDGWINENWIRQHINQENLDVRHINKFLGLLASEIWYRLYVTKETKSNLLLI
ncbi:MAG: asparagine synthase [Thaumarchaeota archaeon]|nr:asparagine synthase [Nitrososphaerota archaeon]